MNNASISQNPGRYIVAGNYAIDYGHRIEPSVCEDESELGESMTLAGFRRAETERSAAASKYYRQDSERLPREAYFG